MRKHLSLIIAVAATFGLFATLLSRAIDSPETPVLSALSSFRYFTLQTNLFVAVIFWVMTLSKREVGPGMQILLGGVTVYISITFLVFALLLQSTWQPTGWAAVGNVFNHYLTPLAVIFYVFTNRQSLRYLPYHIPIWLIYPLIYLIFAFIYGNNTGEHLYFFFNVSDVGWTFFSLTMLGIIALFCLLSVAVIYITKKRVKF